MAGKKVFDGDATTEHVTIDRIAPPAYEAKDIVVAAPPELTHTGAVESIDALRADRHRRCDGRGNGAAYYARSTVARNPAFMMVPLMMLISAVAAMLVGSDHTARRDQCSTRGLSGLLVRDAGFCSDRPLRHSTVRSCGATPIRRAVDSGGRPADVGAGSEGLRFLPPADRRRRPTSRDAVGSADDGVGEPVGPGGRVCVAALSPRHSTVANIANRRSHCAGGRP